MEDRKEKKRKRLRQVLLNLLQRNQQLQSQVSAVEAVCREYEKLIPIVQRRKLEQIRQEKQRQEQRLLSESNEIEDILALARRVRQDPLAKSNSVEKKKDSKAKLKAYQNATISLALPSPISIPKTVLEKRAALKAEQKRMRLKLPAFPKSIDRYLAQFQVDQLSVVETAVLQRYSCRLAEDLEKVFTNFRSFDSSAQPPLECLDFFFPLWFRMTHIIAESKRICLVSKRDNVRLQANIEANVDESQIVCQKFLSAVLAQRSKIWATKPSEAPKRKRLLTEMESMITEFQRKIHIIVHVNVIQDLMPILKDTPVASSELSSWCSVLRLVQSLAHSDGKIHPGSLVNFSLYKQANSI